MVPVKSVNNLLYITILNGGMACFGWNGRQVTGNHDNISTVTMAMCIHGSTIISNIHLVQMSSFVLYIFPGLDSKVFFYLYSSWTGNVHFVQVHYNFIHNMYLQVFPLSLRYSLSIHVHAFWRYLWHSTQPG